MPNPLRIYVLHHPDSAPARELTNRIYDWFRLPSLEGIPVYVRCVAARGKDRPLPPYGMSDRARVTEYLIPLIDAQMVRDPDWHDYLNALAEGCDACERTKQPGYRGVLFPVALDSTAFNLPRAITRRNFIRHGLGPKAGVGDEPAPGAFDAEETLKHLTEALARDLTGQLFPHQAATRFKIFISYARADGIDVAKSLRNYIQSETQCLAFLDENDINYGQPFEESLRRNVGGLARAMIVVNSDHYADRPWCRWEIGRFTRSRRLPLGCNAPTPGEKPPRIHVFDPLLVVDAINGPRMTRVVPELAHAPMVRWDEGRAKLCFTVLMREVLLGLRDVLVARQVCHEEKVLRDAIFVNRLPSPVAIERLLRSRPASARQAGRRRPVIIRYPGNGLSLIELRLLRETFAGVRFRAFRDILPESEGAEDRPAAPLGWMRKALESIECGEVTELPLRGKVLSISTAYHVSDLAAVGILPQHQDEALLHLLRPLLRLGTDLFYGGLPPKEATDSSGKPRPSATRNITAALLRLVSEERREDKEGVGGSGERCPRGSLLFNVCAWPRYENVTERDEAAWVNTYRILRFPPKDAGLPPWPHPVPLDTEVPPRGYLRYVARTISAIRARIGEGFRFRLPDEGDRLIQPSAFIFMGGKLSDFSGIMPGIMEEFYHASKTGRPMFLFGGLGGAARVIAEALCAAKNAPPPEELTVDYYRKQTSTKKHDDYKALLDELESEDPKPQQYFDELWSLIQKHRRGGLDRLFNNGLSDQENRALITTDNTFEAVRMAWKGISQTLLRPNHPAGKAKRPAGPQSPARGRSRRTRHPRS